MSIPRKNDRPIPQGQENDDLDPRVNPELDENNKTSEKNRMDHLHSLEVELVPQVAWLNIIEKLEHKDRITFFRANDSWHNLLAYKIPTLLCPELVPVVATLPQKHFLKFRQFSRSWNTEVTHYLEDYPGRFRFPFEISGGTKVEYIPPPINNFKSAQAIQGFLNDMENHPEGSPFPGGSIALEFEVPRDDPRVTNLRELQMEYWANVFQLLEKYGLHVYFLTFSYDVEELCHATSVDLATTFRQCLLLLPNLQRLSVQGRNDGFDWFDFPLQRYFRDNPLPQLEFLEAFDTHDTHADFIDAVLHSCPVPGNMKRLWIEEIRATSVRFPEPVFNFINLEVLNIPFVSVPDLQRLSQQATLPPLRELGCDIWGDPLKVFRALEPFRNSLIQFMCTGFLQGTGGEWRASTFDLPNLKKLHLTVFKGSFDPLVHLKSLTDLTVDVFRDSPSAMRPHSAPQLNKDLKGVLMERVQTSGFEYIMYESNIWRLIPSLEKLDIKGLHYERRVYDRLCKAQTSKSK